MASVSDPVPLDGPPPEPVPAWLSYLPDYLGVAAAGTLMLVEPSSRLEPWPALVGPSFSLRDPDLALLFDPRLDDVIGRPIRDEQVPPFAVAIAGAAAVLGVAGVDLAAHEDLARTHALLVGAAEAATGTFVVTEGLKMTFGRLRPDFRERYVAAACAGEVGKPAGLDCDAGASPFAEKISRADLYYGMRSFPSGHASDSFALASYGALALGSTHLWGPRSTAVSQPLALLGVGALVGGAAWVSATRLTDNRHHPEDVVVGAALGSTLGAAAYLLHFDLQGRQRARGVTVGPAPLADGGGLAVSGTL
jgi:membrane-associated phospholipid phosphatase